MKKLTAMVLAVSALFGAAKIFAHDGQFSFNSLSNPSVDYLHVSAAVGYESMYMFRGEKRAGNSIQPQVELVYPIAGFDLTAGAWNNSPFYGSKYDDLTEIDLYADLSYSFSSITAKAGYIYYWYTSELQSYDTPSNQEFYVGALFDTGSYFGFNLSPSVFYFYNWVLKQQTVEIAFTYEAPFGEWIGMPAFTLPIGIYGGYVSAGEKNSLGEGISYFYYGAQADLAYRITEYCTISGGVRWSQRNGGEGFDWTNPYQYPIGGRESNIWFGGKVSFGF